VAALLLTALLGGCAAGHDQEPVATPSAPSSVLSESASERLLRTREMLVDQSAFVVEGTIDVGNARQALSILVDTDTASFEADVTMPAPGGDRLKVTMLRTRGMTWVKAPPEYWVMNGYTEAGAESAAGKYVAFEVAAGERIAETYNFGRLISRLRAPSLRYSPDGSSECLTGTCDRYRIGRSDDAPLMYIPTADKCGEERCPALILESQTEGVSALVRVYSADDVRIEYPDPEQVLHPQ